MKFGITKEVEFDAGHRVPNHKSKCQRLHGHRYRVVVHLTGDLHDKAGESDEGMVYDFGDVKDVLMLRVHDKLDHQCIVWEGDKPLLDALGVEYTVVDDARGHIWQFTSLFGVVVFPYIPTAENIARWVFEEMHGDFDHQATLVKVEVWETPTSKAVYPI